MRGMVCLNPDWRCPVLVGRTMAGASGHAARLTRPADQGTQAQRAGYREVGFL